MELSLKFTLPAFGQWKETIAPRGSPARTQLSRSRTLYSVRHRAQWCALMVTPSADGALQTTLYPMMNESKIGKYYNEPSCIPAGTQLVSTLNERYRKVATQLVETSLIDVSHYGRKGPQKNIQTSKFYLLPFGRLSFLFLVLSLPLCQASVCVCWLLFQDNTQGKALITGLSLLLTLSSHASVLLHRFVR